MPLLVPDKVNMNYANMIEEKGLKKTFIIATLVSTLVGTFAASHNLYERLSQKKKDGAQDDAIKKLGEKIDEMKKNDGGGNGGGGGQGQGKSDELRNSLDTSGVLIRREYDYGFDRLGRRFAIGDLITENELQKQIIMLQQTVIRVLEDAMYNRRYIDPIDIDRLVYASRTARNGSLDALKGQYQRILLEMPPPAPLAIRSRSISPPPPRKEFTRITEIKSREPTPAPPSPRRLPFHPPPPPRQQSHSLKKKGKKPNHHHDDDDGMDFFCHYSLDLQRTSSLPLSRTFDPLILPSGRVIKSHCPACRVSLSVDATDMWEIEIPVLIRDRAESVHRPRGRSKTRKSKDKDKDIIAVETTTTRQRREVKVFRIPARFVAKCHTPEGDYACVLCCGPQDGYKGEVVLCNDPEALVDHVAREHRIGDIENEWDILPG